MHALMQRLPQGGRALGAHVLGGDQLGQVAQPQVAARGGELRARERGGGGHPLLHKSLIYGLFSRQQANPQYIQELPQADEEAQ